MRSSRNSIVSSENVISKAVLENERVGIEEDNRGRDWNSVENDSGDDIIIPMENAGGECSDLEDDWFSGGTDDDFFNDGSSARLVSVNTEISVEDAVRSQIIPCSKIRTGRIVGTVFLGILFSGVLAFLTLLFYTRMVRFPNRESIVETETGLYWLKNWEGTVKSMTSLGDDSYIHQEITYANGSELKVKFYERMLSTVSYSPKIVNVKNIYGNDYIDIQTRDVVREESYIEEGEVVNLTYVDYSNVEIDENLLNIVMAEHGIAFNGVDYETVMVDVFCDYMTTVEELPLRTDDYVPAMSFIPGEEKGLGKFIINEEEDIHLDQILFSSRELYELLDRFAEVAARITADGLVLEPTEEWSNWNALSEEEKETIVEPMKYFHTQTINRTWCGTYYLQNEYELKDASGNVIKKGIQASLGDGTVGNPAGYDTGIVTTVFVDEVNEEGNPVTNAYPIKVILRDYKVSEDSIVWFESKDIRNRGMDITSEVQYCSYSIEVVNLSKKELTITDNSCLSDVNANLFPRSGLIYGLVDTLTLQPDESGIIESWSKSTELNRKYLIWGADFERRAEPVYFRVLLGDLEDESENKGVNLNKSRTGEGTSEEEEGINEGVEESVSEVGEENSED